jgi:hypothetical protein
MEDSLKASLPQSGFVQQGVQTDKKQLAVSLRSHFSQQFFAA